jgi:hypothetical protein
MTKTIKINVINTEQLPWSELKNYEFNTLKDKDRDVKKLKNSIVNDGFNMPFYLWADHRYVIDGTGRQLALSELESEGYSIPDLPIVSITAETQKEAIKLVLQASSKNGIITKESLESFTSIFELEELKQIAEQDINIDELSDLFRIPEQEEILRKEYKHSQDIQSQWTTISKEYSTWDGEPYYPVPNQENKNLYSLYQQEAEKLENKGIYFVGRLANYKYFNMDQPVANALDLFKRLNS